MEAANKHVENRMGTEPVGRLLIKMSAPMMISMFVMALYNIVDSIFVAKISANALTGVSVAFPFQMVIVGVAVGTAVGTSSLISRRLGARMRKEADNTASTGLLLSLLSGIVFSLIFFFASELFMGFFAKGDADVLYQSTTYLRICGSLCVFSMMACSAEKILQGTGNMIQPMIIQLAGAVVNIILDPILIFGYFGFPQMGIAGAAVATVAGQFISMLLGFYFLLFYKKNDKISVSFKGFSLDFGIIKDIYNVGVASILMQTVGAFTTLVLNAILMSNFGNIAVNVLGVYFKLQSFVFMPIFGLNSGALPLLGYNFGACNSGRFKKTLVTSVIMSLSIMTVGLLIFQIFPEQLLSLFNADAQMLAIGSNALRAISICFPFAAIGIMFVAAFNAVGNGFYSLIVSMSRQLIIIIPAAFLLARFAGVKYVWFAYPIAELLGMTLSIILIRRVFKRKIKPLGLEQPQTNTEQA